MWVCSSQGAAYPLLLNLLLLAPRILLRPTQRTISRPQEWGIYNGRNHYSNHFYNIYGRYTSKFIGLIPTLIFDMGYMLTFVFVLMFRVIIYKKNTLKTIPFINLVKAPIFLSLIIMSFANAWLAYLLFHIAIIYTFVAYFFFKIRIYFNKTI